MNMKYKYLLKALISFLFIMLSSIIEDYYSLGLPIKLIFFICFLLVGYFTFMAARSEYKSVMKEIEEKNKNT